MAETQQPDPNTPTTTNNLHRYQKPINGRLQPDTLTQIWARIPIKSLYKFRSVCKLWNSHIISDPLLSHLRHFLSPPPPPPPLLLLLRHTPTEPIKIPELPLLVSTRPVEDVVKSGKEPGTFRVKNGFTPYVDYCIDFLPNNKGPVVCFVSERFFYLCNPSTQEFVRVSPGQNGNFNSTTSKAAFGYLEDVNRYVIAGVDGENVEFFEFGSGQAGSGWWRGVKGKCPGRVNRAGLMVNRVFYWTVGDEVGTFAVCLDVKEEEFKAIPPPNNENEVILCDLLYLVEFRGCVCAVDNYSRKQRMEIWVLNEIEGEFSWFRKFSILVNGMDRDVIYPFFEYESENGDEIVLCNETRSRLYCYNVKNRSVKQVFRFKHRTNDRFALYTPGLFPLSVGS